MKVMKEYPVILQKTFQCPKGEEVIRKIEALPDGGEIHEGLLLGKVKVAGKWTVYLGAEERANMVGHVISLKEVTGHSETELTDLDVELLLEEQLRISLDHTEDRKMMGVLQIVQEEETVTETEKRIGQVQEMILKKIEGGIVSEEEMAERLNVMMENEVDPFLIERVIKGYRKYDRPVRRPSCIYVDPYLEDTKRRKEQGIIQRGLRSAVSRHALILEGEKSTGKNVYAETIAWLLGMPSYLITFTRQMSPSSIYGEKCTDNSASELLEAFDSSWLKRAKIIHDRLRLGQYEEGLTKEDKMVLEKEAEFEKLKALASSIHIKMEQSELYDWLTVGGVMIFNECNLADPNFFASFANQLLDGTGYIVIPGRGEVRINPDCVLLGTQNAEYIGTESQNEATMSRFGCIEFEQPKTIVKQLLAGTEAELNRHGGIGIKLKPEYYQQAQAFYTKCRDSVHNGLITNSSLNIRGYIRALAEVSESYGFASLKEQITVQVINTCPNEERSSLKGILTQVVTI